MARGKGTDEQTKLENEIAAAVNPTQIAGNPELEDAFERLMREDTGERVTWQPEPGDWVVGPVVSRRDGVCSQAMLAKGYKPCTVLSIESRLLGCVVDVWCMATVLRSEIEAQNPQPGQIVGVKYFGVKGETEYHHYAFRIDGGR